MIVKFCFPEHLPDADKPYYPLTAVKIKDIFKRLKETYGSENVIPGSLLPELNLLLYRHVYEEK